MESGHRRPVQGAARQGQDKTKHRPCIDLAFLAQATRNALPALIRHPKDDLATAILAGDVEAAERHRELDRALNGRSKP